MARVDDNIPNQPRDANGDEDSGAASGDLPGLLDDVPPSGDLTPGDAATRAAAPGIRQDPPEPKFVPADPESSDSDDIEVDTGSPQDYGDPNDDVVREQDDDATPRPSRRDEE